LNWKFVADGIVISSPSIGPDGTVYFGSKNGIFYAITYTTGELKWKYELPNGDYMKTATGISSTGSLYFGTQLGDVYSLFSNGQLNWKFTTNQESCFNQNLAIDILNNV
jgi:outer membrane protein assembly factor BamB